MLKFFQTAKSEANFKGNLSLSILESSLRQVLGSVPFKKLLSVERAELMTKIREILDKEASSFGVKVLDVRIMRADLPEKSRSAVFRRMRTERDKEAKQIRAQGAEEAQKIVAEANKTQAVILAEARRDASIIKGEGDAKSIVTFANAYNKDVEFFEFYRSMNAYKNALDKENTTVILGTDNNFLKYIK